MSGANLSYKFMFLEAKSLFGYLRHKVVFVLVLVLPVNSFAWFGSRDKELDEIGRSDMPKVEIHGFPKGKVTFTQTGKELYEAFLKNSEHDMTQIRQMLNRYPETKTYHLYSAFCYGFNMWEKTSNPYEKEKIKRATWNIAMEFSHQNTPRWQASFLKFGPTILWIIVVMFTVLWGSYLRKNNSKFFEKYSDRIFEWAMGYGKSAPSK